MNEKMKKEIVPFLDALVKFSITENVISDLEDSTKLEITDSASEKVIRKHRQNAKGLEVKINKTRLALNREFKEKTEQAAGLIAPRITAAYKALNEKITVVETAREEAKARKAKAENERTAAIQARFDILTNAASKPLEYNRESADIEVDIANLKAFEINEVDFQERTIEACSIKSGAITNARSALDGRKGFEAGQAEAARIKAEQAAEAERLKKEKAEIEKASAEAAKVRAKEAAIIKAEREQLEADKAEAERQNIISKRESFWEEAHQENIDIDHNEAIAWNNKIKAAIQAEFDKTDKAKKAKAERIKPIDPDKLILQTIANDIDTLISEYEIPEMNTDEANALVCDLISSIKSRIFIFDNDARDLK